MIMIGFVVSEENKNEIRLKHRTNITNLMWLTDKNELFVLKCFIVK